MCRQGAKVEGVMERGVARGERREGRGELEAKEVHQDEREQGRSMYVDGSMAGPPVESS
jgi:hypothetical protein